MSAIAIVATALAASWCSGDEASTEHLSELGPVAFTLENGKTVSICQNADSSDLTYFYGTLGEPPELAYRAPLLGRVEGLLGYGYDLAQVANAGFGQPTAIADMSLEAVAAAAQARDSGFILIRSAGCCGGEETAIMFKRGGWEYAVRMGYSRNVNPDIAAELGDYTNWKLITLISPEGQEHTIR
ncbi:MAG: hypothetical protein OXI66_15885 [Boseongicola sp.]|nr:hypothetical protein [Boseongicola sp.]